MADKLDGLSKVFRRKLEAVISDMAGHGMPIRVTEGLRSQARQKALYAQGRTKPGPIVTQLDGVNHRSNHQRGIAADVCSANGKPYPPLGTQFWKLLQSSAHAHELTSGGDWKKFKDWPHLELSSE